MALARALASAGAGVDGEEGSQYFTGALSDPHNAVYWTSSCAAVAMGMRHIAMSQFRAGECDACANELEAWCVNLGTTPITSEDDAKRVRGVSFYFQFQWAIQLTICQQGDVATRRSSRRGAHHRARGRLRERTGFTRTIVQIPAARRRHLRRFYHPRGCAVSNLSVPHADAPSVERRRGYPSRRLGRRRARRRRREARRVRAIDARRVRRPCGRTGHRARVDS